MRAASTLTATGLTLLAAALTAATPALGASFGRSANATQLGQPLNFTASIRPDPDETLSRDCVFVEVQSGENLLPAAQIRYALESPTDASERRLRVTTRIPIDEPVVTVTLTVGCDAKVTRRFVAFVDPPGVNMAQSAAPAAPGPVAPPAAETPTARSSEAPAPARLAADGARIERPARPTRPARPLETAAAPLPRATVVPRPAVVATAASAAQSPTPRARSAVAPRASRVPPGPRLQLEPSPPTVAVAAPVPATLAAAAAALPVPPAPAVTAVAPAATTLAASSLPPSGPEASLSERQRIQSLEDGLLRLRNESRGNEAALAALQARLQQAESERYGNPLVYALALLSALLALGLVLLGRRQAVSRRTGQWWVGKDPGPVPSMYRERGAVPSVLPASPSVLPAPGAAPAAPAAPLRSAHAARDVTVPPEATRPAPFVASSSATQPYAAQLPLRPAAPPQFEPAAPARESSVEELIDLEQQVDFFVVLGQDDPAIELLMSHVRSDGGISPLPYLKLLEIYRRRGDTAAYQQTRDRFNRRFNAHAPRLEDDPAHGRSLADYPETIARLQQLWRVPAHAMEALDATLMRRRHIEETFDLPAYRELLFLYAVARDLAEHPAAASADGVDLMLPLDEPDAAPIGRLSATVSGHDDFQPSDLNTMPLDLDVSFASPPTPPGAETVPAALRRTDSRLFSTESNFVDFDASRRASRGTER